LTPESVRTDATAPVTLLAFPQAIFSRIRWAIREQTQRDPCRTHA
tara:strand:+ start:186 stop:320 length:135 start_codon:yes stop_codon:yes gene_type:complete